MCTRGTLLEAAVEDPAFCVQLLRAFVVSRSMRHEKSNRIRGFEDVGGQIIYRSDFRHSDLRCLQSRVASSGDRYIHIN